MINWMTECNCQGFYLMSDERHIIVYNYFDDLNAHTKVILERVCIHNYKQKIAFLI